MVKGSILQVIVNTIFRIFNFIRRMIDFVVIKELIGMAKTLFNIAKWGHKISYAWNYLVSAPYCVIVYGASGVGKTEFCRSLLGKSIESSNAPRTVIHQIENLILEDGHKIRLYDLPGHVSYKANRDKVMEEIANRKSYGIINVVSYGYHEVPEAQNLKVFKVGNEGEKTNEIDTQFLKENLKREFDQAKEWHTGNSLSRNIGWIITVVNKADVWSAKHDIVLDYYQNDGEYTKNLFGNQAHLVKYVFPYCSIISPFCQKAMPLEISERQKVDMHKHLLEHLIRLVKDER